MTHRRLSATKRRSWRKRGRGRGSLIPTFPSCFTHSPEMLYPPLGYQLHSSPCSLPKPIRPPYMHVSARPLRDINDPSILGRNRKCHMLRTRLCSHSPLFSGQSCRGRGYGHGYQVLMSVIAVHDHARPGSQDIPPHHHHRIPLVSVVKTACALYFTTLRDPLSPRARSQHLFLRVRTTTARGCGSSRKKTASTQLN